MKTSVWKNKNNTGYIIEVYTREKVNIKVFDDYLEITPVKSYTDYDLVYSDFQYDYNTYIEIGEQIDKDKVKAERINEITVKIEVPVLKNNNEVVEIKRV